MIKIIWMFLVIFAIGWLIFARKIYTSVISKGKSEVDKTVKQINDTIPTDKVNK